jgi:hypothetical protein
MRSGAGRAPGPLRRPATSPGARIRARHFSGAIVCPRQIEAPLLRDHDARADRTEDCRSFSDRKQKSSLLPAKNSGWAAQSAAVAGSGCRSQRRAGVLIGSASGAAPNDAARRAAGASA